MKKDKLKLWAFPMGGGFTSQSFKPAERLTPWQLATEKAMATRCLPLNIANCYGWQIFCPGGFDAVWSGLDGTDAIDIIPHGDGPMVNETIFGYGVLTFHVGVLFKTSPGHNMMIQGPMNEPKDGIQALSGIIETDWSPYSLTMNWKFTRPGRVTFKKGEAFAQFFPIQRGYIEDFEAEFLDLHTGDPEKEELFHIWSKSRNDFHDKIAAGDEETIQLGWQKLYFRGLYPDGKRKKDDHQTKLKLSPFKDNSGFDFEHYVKEAMVDKKSPLSACVVCLNDEVNIQGYLDNIAPHVTEVLVLDLGSVDKTLEIINNYPRANVKLLTMEEEKSEAAILDYFASQVVEDHVLLIKVEDRVLDGFWAEMPVYLNRLEKEVSSILHPLFLALFPNDIVLNELNSFVKNGTDYIIPTGGLRPTICRKEAILSSHAHEEQNSLTADDNVYSLYPDNHKIRNPEFVLRKMFFEEKMGQAIDQATFEALTSTMSEDQIAAMRDETLNSNSSRPHDTWWGEQGK